MAFVGIIGVEFISHQILSDGDKASVLGVILFLFVSGNFVLTEPRPGDYSDKSR